jgi:hypothetical protein
MKRLTCLLLALLIVSPVWAAKVLIDYDKNADLSKYKSFQYHASKDNASTDNLMDGRIVDALQGMLKEAGLTEVDSGADLAATYHVKTEEQTSFTTTGMGYGMGAGWGRWGGGMGGMGGMATTTEQTWTDGTLILDLWDPATKKLVWRGSASQTLKGNPEKRSKQIDQAFDGMLKKWQKMRGEN